MARPPKQGIDYFPLDCGFLDDIKIRKIIRACGLNSIPILICLLANIYNDEGYYVVWDEDLAFLVADKLGISEGLVIETVKKAVAVGFFHQGMFDNHKILTSVGIQKRFFSIVKSLKRKVTEFNATFMLISISPSDNLVSTGGNEVSPCINEEKKRNEKKRNEKKDRCEEKLLEDFNSLCKNKVSSQIMKNFIVKFNIEKGVHLVEELKHSAWLRDNFNLQAVSSDFLQKILNGNYRDFKQPKRNKFHNFKQITDDYTEDELEEVARRKRREAFEKMGVE